MEKLILLRFFTRILISGNILQYILYSVSHVATPYHRFIADIFHLCSFPRCYVERCAGVACISRLRSLRVTLFFVLEGKLTMHAKINIRLLSVGKSKLINIARRQNRIRYNERAQCTWVLKRLQDKKENGGKGKEKM